MKGVILAGGLGTRLLGNGSEFGLEHPDYTYQEGEGERVTRIVEKPTDPPSPYAVTGCYFFDARVFEIIGGLEPSERGELEITDVNNRYIEWGEMSYRILDGWWTDAGAVPSLHRAARWVAEAEGNPVLRPPNVPTAENL